MALGGDCCGIFEFKLKSSAISTFFALQLMCSDEVPLAIFRDAVFLQCLRVRNNETTFLLREMNAIEGRDTMAVEDEEKTEPPSQGRPGLAATYSRHKEEL